MPFRLTAHVIFLVLCFSAHSAFGEASIRPVADYEPVSTIVLDSNSKFDSGDVKKKIIENIPQGVTVIITHDPGDDIEQLKAQFSKINSSIKIEFLETDESVGFWARDSLPYPVIRQHLSHDQLELVDARYYGTEPDQVISSFLKVPLNSHLKLFEGGNLVANDDGECITIHNSYASLSNGELLKYYGCEKVLRLPHIDGIGHADERVKFVNRDTVLTDTEEYVIPLMNQGYVVTMLPRAKGYETYLNSVFVNGVALVPTYGIIQDAFALKIYERYGFVAVGINTKKTVTQGAGSLHCMTMTYPAATTKLRLLLSEVKPTPIPND